jgi:hypothetical protein
MYVTVGQNVDFQLADVDTPLFLSGSSVGGDLGLGDGREKSAPVWGDEAWLSLRNTKIGSLQDSETSWDGLDNRLDLAGFEYARLGGGRTVAGASLADRDTEWLLAWLGKQANYPDQFFAQPYRQLASALEAHGYEDKAKDIMIAANNHRRQSEQASLPTKAALWLEAITIGYGYEAWRAIGFVFALAIFGTLVASGRISEFLECYLGNFDRSHEATPMTLGEAAWFSIDKLVPIVSLDPYHSQVSLTGWPRYYTTAR